MMRSALVCCLLAFSVSAVAQDEGFDYNYLQASYQQVDYDFGGDGDGFGLDAGTRVVGEVAVNALDGDASLEATLGTIGGLVDRAHAAIGHLLFDAVLAEQVALARAT